MNYKEDLYLKAKIAYYEGNPIMTDLQFDSLEEELKKSGSDVVNQIGSKSRDFDFSHPSRMRSLAKIQTENKGLFVDYKYEDFLKWYKKRADTVGNQKLIVSPKFDGNAINIIYNSEGIVNILSRGDGKSGKTLLNKLGHLVPEKINIRNHQLLEGDIVEIRCEVVMDLNIFREKYLGEFANARNYVAGLLGKDDADLDRISDLKIIPLYFLINGKHAEPSEFSNNSVFHSNYSALYDHTSYIDAVKMFETIRKSINYQLDGVVFNFPAECREELGEADHHPEWAIAIKFIPEDVIASVIDIEWNISKSGELIPTVIFDTVFLDGSNVSRASGYNAGYILQKNIGPGAKVGLAKSGDIIPEIQRIIESSEIYEDDLPKKCPVCEGNTEFDGIHLMCKNPSCRGKISKQLANALKVLDIRGIGEKSIEPFSKEFSNIYQIMKWARTEGKKIGEGVEKYGLKFGSKSCKIFLDAFSNIKKIPYEKIIQTIGYENVGEKIASKIAEEYNGGSPSYANLDKSVVSFLRSEKTRKEIESIIEDLRSLGISIEYKKDAPSDSVIFACLTGSPKEFGYKTKGDFLKKFPSIKEVSITDKSCKMLITDSIDSDSSKMKSAKKLQINIATYGDF